MWYVYLLTVKENEDAVACGNRNMKKRILFFHPVIILIEYSLRTVILFPQMLTYGWLYRDFHGYIRGNQHVMFINYHVGNVSVSLYDKTNSGVEDNVEM